MVAVEFFVRMASFYFSDKIFTMQFLRKYIHFAKSMRPDLTEEASKYIGECYADLRSFDATKVDRERVCLPFVKNIFLD